MAGAEEEQVRVRWRRHPGVPLQQNAAIGQLFVAAHKLRRQPISEQVGEGRAGGVGRQHGRAGFRRHAQREGVPVERQHLSLRRERSFSCLLRERFCKGTSTGTYSEYVFTRIIRVFEPWLNTRLNTVYS